MNTAKRNCLTSFCVHWSIIVSNQNLLIDRRISCDYASQQLKIFICVVSVHGNLINKPICALSVMMRLLHLGVADIIRSLKHIYMLIKIKC